MVAFRGTQELEDNLTDAYIRPVKFIPLEKSAQETTEGAYVHAGFSGGYMSTREDIYAILEQLIDGDDEY